jgi:hypothetical protein
MYPDSTPSDGGKNLFLLDYINIYMVYSVDDGEHGSYGGYEDE